FNAVLAALSLGSQTRDPRPHLLLGTAFSFVHLLDFLDEKNLRFDLPAGSRVMETGGYKNRSRSMPKVELHALITERLGVPPENIICEYGMSELSSQAYAVTSDKWRVTREAASSCHLSPVTCHFQFPPWSRVQIISPETGREVAEGETGLIRVFDLANVFSVMAIQTEDLAICHREGFELLGRAPLAEPRGCSLMSHFALRTPHSNEPAELFSRRSAAGSDAVADDDHRSVPDIEAQPRPISRAARDTQSGAGPRRSRQRLVANGQPLPKTRAGARSGGNRLLARDTRERPGQFLPPTHAGKFL